MSRADGVLTVVLTRRWFDMIESGEKLEEYRGDHWATRLFGKPGHWHPYHTLRAFDGYRKGRRVLERKIRCIRRGTPRPEWSGDTVTGECFVIELYPSP